MLGHDVARAGICLQLILRFCKDSTVIIAMSSEVIMVSPVAGSCRNGSCACGMPWLAIGCWEDIAISLAMCPVSESVKRCRAMLAGVCALQAWLACYKKLRIIRFEGVMSLSRSRPNVCKEGVRLTWTSLCGLQSLSCDLNAAPTETWLLNGAGCWNERTNEEWTEVVAT